MSITQPATPKVHFPQARRDIEGFGYSCQAHIALEVYKEVFGSSTGRVWFSRRFNPVDNVDSSNPAEIYRALSRAVQTGDMGSKIIRGYMASLAETVDRFLTDPQRKRELRDGIFNVPIESFRPTIWLLDLKAIAEKRSIGVRDLLKECRKKAENAVNKGRGQVLQPDEYLLADHLSHDDYAIMVDG